MVGMATPFIGRTNVGKANGIKRVVGATNSLCGVNAPRRLTQLPSWLLSEAARRGHQLVSEGFAQEGVRKAHFTVLVALDEHGPASQAELGRRLWIDGSDMVAVLNDLEDARYVERTRDELDRRRNVVALTASGIDALERLNARVDAAQDALLAALSAKERRELTRLLTRVTEPPPAR
jgi:DNA-binding MarR family transcriptional regulator